MKYSQLGRSMMEMLGVLAIVGVLSIGGLMGFKYAIDRKSANDILYDVNMMAALVQTNELLDRMTVGQELAENRLEFIKGSTATFKVGKETDKTIYIDATGVPEKVCTKLLRSDPASVEEIIANMGDGCLEGNENSVVFYLNKKMTKDTQNPDRFKRCETSADCGTCGECKSEICVANATLCGSDKPHCVDFNCQKCPKGEIFSGENVFHARLQRPPWLLKMHLVKHVPIVSIPMRIMGVSFVRKRLYLSPYNPNALNAQADIM